MPGPATIHELPTPALVVEAGVFEANVAVMAAALPGERLRPHVKAFKSTALARRLEQAGHRSFCGATVREIEGMVEAGVGNDLLLANQALDYTRLGALVEHGADITVAVDSIPVLEAARRGGVRRVLIDVDVGLARCGCAAEEAGSLADAARRAGLDVRGVMGYEGHLMMAGEDKAARVEQSMQVLLAADAEVGGFVVSAGGTGTYAVNQWATEIQAGSYCLLDVDYARLDSPFEIAVSVLASVISVTAGARAVVDAGLKAFGLDKGVPIVPDAEVLRCSDEHTVIADAASHHRVGDRVRLLPTHLDPTVARHERFWVVDGDEVVDMWPIDLRHW